MYAQQCQLFPSKTHATGPEDVTFAADSWPASVLDAEASRIDDRDRILRVLLNEFNRAEIDSIVHQLRIHETPTPMNTEWLSEWMIECSVAAITTANKATTTRRQ